MIGDAAEAAATGYLAGGPGASGGRACSTVARPSSQCSRQKGKKSRLRQAKIRLEKRSLPGRETLDCFGWPRKRDFVEAGQVIRAHKAGDLAHSARPLLVRDHKLTAVVLHYRQSVVVVARFLVRGMVCDDTARRRVDAMHANEARRSEAMVAARPQRTRSTSTSALPSLVDRSMRMMPLTALGREPPETRVMIMCRSSLPLQPAMKPLKPSKPRMP